MKNTNAQLNIPLKSAASEEKHAQQSLVIQAFSLLASSLEHQFFQAAATDLATNLAIKLSCERVSIGLAQNKQLRICAMSHSARWDKRTNLVQSINAAMDESCDQETTIIYPPPAKDANKKYSKAHKKLSDFQNGAALCTIPLANEGRIMGAITLERAKTHRFTTSSVQLVELVAVIAGPLLEMKHQEERWILKKNWDSLRDFFQKIIGHGHVKTKLYSVVLLALIVFFSVASTTHRISADSVVEGSIQRTVSAAEDGFIESSTLRAGDQVEENQLLAKLDDSDLQLEIEKLENRRNELNHEYQEALVQHERVKVSLINIKIEKTNNELKIIKEKLSRLQVTAPFKGIIIEGDLTQSLGMPIKKGDAMFKIAPLNDYRVIMKVNESDIGHIKEKQKGSLTLTGLPNKEFTLTVSSITPVSIAKDGSNFFHVEAELKAPDPLMRPNMKGVSKIETGEKKLFWILTHRIVDWLRIKTWSLLP